MMTKTPPLSITPHGSGWKVASASQPGLFYYVSLLGRRQTCTCEAFLYDRLHLACKHIRAVRQVLAEKEMVYSR